MPNTAVKLSSADGSWGFTPARVGRCQATGKLGSTLTSWFFVVIMMYFRSQMSEVKLVTSEYTMTHQPILRFKKRTSWSALFELPFLKAIKCFGYLIHCSSGIQMEPFAAWLVQSYGYFLSCCNMSQHRRLQKQSVATTCYCFFA